MGGGQDKPAWTACPPGVKITRVGGKITRDSLPPGGQAVQGGKINCYTGQLQNDKVHGAPVIWGRSKTNKMTRLIFIRCQTLATVTSRTNDVRNNDAEQP